MHTSRDYLGIGCAYQQFSFRVADGHCAGLPRLFAPHIVDEVAIYLPFATFHRQYLEVASFVSTLGLSHASTRIFSD
jgi:hypothetical protein